MAKKGYTRFQFEFSKDAVNSLERVIKNTDSSTKADAIRKALRFYFMSTSAQRRKKVIALSLKKVRKQSKYLQN